MNVRKLGGGEKAFTLIELLVVIGIVAVIAAILFPVFFAARERGRRTQCLSNERQLGMAISQYAADSNEVLFTAGANSYASVHGFGWAGTGLGWAGCCYPYVKNTQVYRCPDDTTADVAIGESGGRVGWAMYAVSYGFNSNLAGVKFVNPSPPVPLGQATAPARTVLLFEVSGNVAPVTDPGGEGDSAYGNVAEGSALVGPDGAAPDPTCPMGYNANPPGSVPFYTTGNIGGFPINGATKNGIVLPGALGSIPRHGSGSNYAACDGHVAWLRPEQISPGFSAASADDPPVVRITRTAAGTALTAAGTAFPRYVLTFSNK